ncbi:GSCOCG00003200001-RA-CDS [Cotesia congregata]|nr:GSCOCG00003200001-RA-CDS [Cotesia congregata]
MGPEFFLVGKLFILITGASKGIGRQFAITFSQIAECDSHFLLIARNETGLQETVSKMSHRVNVDYVSLDLSIAQADQLKGNFSAYYCSAKAAREMYFKVFAKEFPQVNVLNYSPFFTQTDLLKELEGIKRTAELPILSLMFRFAGLILTPNQVADRLVEIIRGQKYKSGDFVDYYDPITSALLLTGQELHII